MSLPSTRVLCRDRWLGLVFLDTAIPSRTVVREQELMIILLGGKRKHRTRVRLGWELHGDVAFWKWVIDHQLLELRESPSAPLSPWQNV